MHRSSVIFYYFPCRLNKSIDIFRFGACGNPSAGAKNKLLILIGLFILFAVWQQAYTFIAVIILTAAVLILRFRQQPLTVHCAVREEGLEVGERYFAWKDFKEFWIIYRPPEVKKVFFDFKTPRPSIDLPLQTENPIKLRQILSERLVENVEREEEPASDQLTRMLKI